ncbi:gamma-glutamyltranspeptidase/glutathione hydrolase [Paenibacillus sp. DS2015]|uniref:gamma-glutamyltransferase n=1 Tax=Paenibacillus sp. DS2015 TaxID=3373917 RepID=UPI003D19EA56
MLNSMPTSRRAMVTTPHHLASSVGSAILQSGGNAFDAAVAISAALGVVYPHMTGMGGDAFFVVHHGASGTFEGFNGSGRSAAQATPDKFRELGFEAIPRRGVLSAITVPGMVDTWWQVWSRYGRLPWKQLLEPAILYAEQGFPISPDLHFWMVRDETWIMGNAALRKVYAYDGELLTEGDVLIQSDLAASLRLISEQGAATFYSGELMHSMISAIRADGGLLEEGDYITHHGEWVEPLMSTYRQYEIYQMPPNSQGFSMLMMLNMLENIEVKDIPRNSAQFYHVMTEVIKKAFQDRDLFLTDPEFREIPIDQLLSKVYALKLWKELSVSPEVATPYLSQAMGQDTAYAAVVDEEGNAVSFIQSLYFDFGSAYIAGDTGIIMQNRGSFFSMDEGSPNILEPHKRSFHTLMPTMVSREGRLHMLLGTQGGEGQPQTQLSILTGVLDYGLNIQEAISLPRWLYGRTWGDSSDTLKLEYRLGLDDVHVKLQEWGHAVEMVSEWDDRMGQAQGIVIHEQGTISGAADPRADGSAIGW